MSNAVLEFRGVVKRYGRRTALDGLDLAVERGVILGLVGSNGAGKTTALLAAAGLIRPTRGEIRVFGNGAFDPARQAGRLSLVPQDSDLPRHATVRSLLHFYGRLQGLTAREAEGAALAMLERCHLADRAGSTIRALSHGMRKRVMLAQALIGEPELVLLDEPMSGLDPVEVANVRGILTDRRGRQTIVMSSHVLTEVERMCDRVAFIERGSCQRQDSVAELLGRLQVLRYVLGAGAVPVEDLRALLPDADFAAPDALATDRERVLVCRFGDGRPVEEINALVLECLLRRGVGVREIRRGGELEDAYLRHRAGGT